MSNEQQRTGLYDRLERLLATSLDPKEKERALQQLLNIELSELAQEDDPSRKVIKAKRIVDDLFAPETLDYDHD